MKIRPAVALAISLLLLSFLFSCSLFDSAAYPLPPDLAAAPIPSPDMAGFADPPPPNPGEAWLAYPYPGPFHPPSPTVDPIPYPWPRLGPEPSPLPTLTSTPTMVPIRTQIDLPGTGLAWHECEMPEGLYLGWNQGEECLGIVRDYYTQDEITPFGEHIHAEDELSPYIRLSIGEDVFETHLQSSPDGGFTDRKGMGIYTLQKNGQLLLTRTVLAPNYDPNLSLLDVNGQYAWQLSDLFHPTVIYAGQDQRETYGLDGAFVPWVLNDRLIYMARKDSRHFVMYAGEQIGPEFDEVYIAYCCESALYSIQRPQEQYWFWGIRDGRHYIVAITDQN